MNRLKQYRFTIWVTSVGLATAALLVHVLFSGRIASCGVWLLGAAYLLSWIGIFAHDPKVPGEPPVEASGGAPSA